jgi:phosphatidylserine/phosphatidylglycerophosphate/cardiolipin synthase-like enzyme
MRLARPGETCWRLERSRRARFLVDGQDFFDALRRALLAARASIHLLGWGFDPRIRLLPVGDAPDAGGISGPGEVGHLLVALTKANPALDVRLLVWRSALPISATQAFFPHRARAWFRGSGVDFRLDAEVPFGACHHQKVIVIDGALAFVGGADLMPGRWDTSEHRDDDSRRAEGGRTPPSRHEIVAMVDGPAAAAFDELFEARWRASRGTSVTLTHAADDAWPAGIEPDAADTDVAIARTLPAWRGRPGVGEIAALNLEAILRAKRLIYLENQYFTWPPAAEALAARLAEPDGPEVVLITSERSPSYFDRLTMDRARTTILWRLTAGDVFGRFHAFAPFTAGGRPIVVHAKAMVVDDTLALIGSANLNNRSQGFDTECELVIEAQTEPERAAISGLRDRLASHWIGRSAAELSAARGERGALAGALRDLDANGRVRPLQARRLGPVGEFIADFHLGDPSSVSDSWRLGRRRRNLITESRAVRAAAISSRG